VPKEATGATLKRSGSVALVADCKGTSEPAGVTWNKLFSDGVNVAFGCDEGALGSEMNPRAADARLCECSEQIYLALQLKKL